MTRYWKLSTDYTSACSVAEAFVSEALWERSGFDVEIYYFRGWASRFDCEALGAVDLCNTLGLGVSGRVEVRGRLLAAFPGRGGSWLALLAGRGGHGSLAVILDGVVTVSRGEGVELRGIRGEFSSAYSIASGGGGSWRRMELEGAALSYEDAQYLAEAVDALLESMGVRISRARLAAARRGVALSLGGPGLELLYAGEGRVSVRRPASPRGAWEDVAVEGVSGAVSLALLRLAGG